MFKKKCKHCNNKVSRDFEFCPYCGKNLAVASSPEDYGILGKNDFDNSIPENGFGDAFMDRVFDSAMKMLEKQMQNMANQQREPMRGDMRELPNRINNHNSNFDVQFFVNGKRVDFSGGQGQGPRQGIPQKQRKQNIIPIKTELTAENAERLATLPKQEPASTVRRLSGRVIYELAVPGVDNIDDILINRLENSIEIKAISDSKVYSKIINVNLPILGYRLENDSLYLELQAK